MVNDQKASLGRRAKINFTISQAANNVHLLWLIQQYFGIFKLDQTTYYVSVIPVNIDILHILALNIGTLVCCMLMLIIPSFIISKITPVKAIRYS